VSQSLALVIQVIATVVLARLLDPADFGLVAMVTTFSLLLVNFGGNGFTEAVVQRDEIGHALASNLFWVTTSISFALALGFAASGSLLAHFYKDPRVTSATAAMALTILLTGISVLHLALLRRAMRFFAVSIIGIIAQASTVAVSIILALRGWGYWALIAGAIASPLATSVGAWTACRWVPGLPRRGVGTGPMVRFALHIYGFFSLNYVTRNVDNLLMGTFFGPQPLGLYKKAYDLANLPYTQVSSPLTAVAVPTLSRLKDDPVRHSHYLLRSFSILSFIGMGMAACLTVVGRDLIQVLLGPRWVEAGKIFTVFAPGIAALFVYGINGWIHLSIGRADRYFRWGVVECTLLCLALLLGVRWGAMGLAAAWTSYYWLLVIPAIHYAGKPINFTIGPVVAAVWRFFLAALLAGCASAVILRGFPTLLAARLAQAAIRLVLVSSSFTVLYLGAVIALHQGCTPIYQLLDLLREIAPWERSSKVFSVAAATDH
jgi:PST family polysaccharide transporter